MSDYTIKLEGDEIPQWELAKEAVAEVLARAEEIQSDRVTEVTYDAMTRLQRRVADADARTILSLKDSLLDELERIRGAGLLMQFGEDQARARAVEILQGLDSAEEALSSSSALPPIPEEIKVPQQVKARRPKLNKVANTSHPTLTRAVIRQLGDKDNLIDVSNHGADAGFCNFVYYKDTVPFFEKHRKEILSVLEADGEEPASMVFGFNCLRLKEADREEQRAYRGAINRLLYGNRKVDWDRQEEIMVANALSWFALEEVARDMVIDS